MSRKGLRMAYLIGLVPRSYREAKLFLHISQYSSHQTTAVEEERRVVGRSYRKTM